jgi:hypothetical protein
MINNFLLDVLAAGAILSGILFFTTKNPVIAVLYVATFMLFIVIHTQSFVDEMSIFSGIAIGGLAPIKPGAETNLTDTVSPKKRSRLSRAEQEQFSLTPKEKEIVVGLILGDLFVEKQQTGVNSRLRFEQGTIHKDYLLHLYDIFQKFCSACPKTINRLPDKITGKEHSSIRISTYSLPCFNEFHGLFYSNGTKIIPQNIAELLTPLSLAYWLSDDGSLHKLMRYVVLCTNSFTLAEVNLLADALNSKWDLKCYVNKHTSGYIIVIPRKSVPILQKFCGPHMPRMMKHKIGL